MSEKTIFQSQFEHQQSKYIGAGHSEISQHEWVTNQHRDTIAAYIGHSHFITYFSIVNNESQSRTRYELLKKIYLPCGVDPVVQSQYKHSNIHNNDNTDMKQ